ncbi:hypothetical protein CLV28_0221 [Sediminihabitans luteus]|uniref:Uncharacterized protein n=1 Tax=Sediminihabitans luteus TaxID=1138585 RepID=A0A2M9CYJ8_9CELL|nr:hypothetical protein [Sediminihabitans luteus]PJJ77009.1 hypothetical protein CLV28_0221 [Sediminihabitans luteus]GII99651.1 hypothetical protein Slu03_20290 [Sediminihabitans luteus]
MLGRSERESGAHARSAVTAAGWDDHEPVDAAGPGARPAELELLDLGTTSATLATVARIEGLRAVLHVGHPQQPAHELERAMLAADPSLVLTASVAVLSQWAWVAPAAAATGGVVVDEAGMRDCRHVLRTMGASPHLVPTRTSLAERVEIAGPGGSLVIERSRVPAGWVELAGSERLRDADPIWYGLVESRAEATITDGGAQVWLAFGPSDDHRGSLQRVLGVLADVGIDLDHLRSHPSSAGPHVFFASFGCSSTQLLRDLLARLTEQSVAQRVLAVLPGREFVPSPHAFTPRWDAARPVAATTGA